MRKKEFIADLSASGFSKQPGVIWRTGVGKICCLWWQRGGVAGAVLRVSAGKNFVWYRPKHTPPYKRIPK